jgi:outer membrane protein OmpA-like peptidoglycan-associated protein
MASIFVIGCAHTEPKELENARTAYERAANTPAPTVAPGELADAQAALKRAEIEWDKRPRSQRARDLAYVAERKAEYAESVTATELDRMVRERVVSDLSELQQHQLALALERLRQSGAKVTQEPRGMVITLTSAVLFPFDDAKLSNESEKHLSKLAEGLMITKERDLIIEGHTDKIGPHEYNVDLSEKRAEAVKAYLVKHGYDANLIQTKGLGEDRPLAPNDSVENRATNRRVEIIITQPKKE